MWEYPKSVMGVIVHLSVENYITHKFCLYEQLLNQIGKYGSNCFYEQGLEYKAMLS